MHCRPAPSLLCSLPNFPLDLLGCAEPDNLPGLYDIVLLAEVEVYGKRSRNDRPEGHD
jgi:hypothetical protein